LYQERQPHSPDQARSAAEWKLVRALFDDPILMRFASQNTTHAHTEFPFAWSIHRRAALEGVIDLLLIDQAAGQCLLLDWKTNRIAKGKEESLRTLYRPQIAAYWKAIREITRLEVEAGLYSTSTGKLVMFNPAALETEWARLANLPAEQMRAELAPEDL
jgi:ATP-dependent exoDNAse (exonuclease V) beta subunit